MPFRFQKSSTVLTRSLAGACGVQDRSASGIFVLQRTCGHSAAAAHLTRSRGGPRGRSRGGPRGRSRGRLRGRHCCTPRGLFLGCQPARTRREKSSGLPNCPQKPPAARTTALFPANRFAYTAGPEVNLGTSTRRASACKLSPELSQPARPIQGGAESLDTAAESREPRRDGTAHRKGPQEADHESVSKTSRGTRTLAGGGARTAHRPERRAHPSRPHGHLRHRPAHLQVGRLGPENDSRTDGRGP